MKYCKGIHCPNKKQCKRYVKLSECTNPTEIINNCLNNKEFLKNG